MSEFIEIMDFDKWFAETFPQFMSGIEPLEPFYSIASIAYEKALREKRIAELEKENAELTCQMKRNIYCYSCKNATEKCYKKEIGCPCGKYESYKDENAELKLKLEALEGETPWKDIKDKSEVIGQLTKAKEIIKKYMRFKPVVGGVQYYHEEYEQTEKEAEQFLEEIKEK